MKQFIKNFAQGMYDSLLEVNTEFCNKYSFDDFFEITYRFFFSLFLKGITFILGIIACALASSIFSISFSALFWLWFIFCMSWCIQDKDLHQFISILQEIQNK